ncbi:MAG: hypothetical protein CMP62_03815 [Flavobacteriales bacterium]|nr:hypothetical protein [Flavobacteriales bacterium]|tara:strand:- start:1912 stop:2385 length:474 start_codon:yes stop_codon:yes gene_type:complete
MKKFNLFAVACLLTAFSFAQTTGQWSFGAGGDFTSPNADANIGYFVMDGLMLSFDFNMAMDYEVEVENDTPTEVEGSLDWGMGLRYYACDNLFIEGAMKTGADDDLDMTASAGVSLELGFDGKLWFEPMIQLTMPGADYGPQSQNNLGLAWAFRYTF